MELPALNFRSPAREYRGCNTQSTHDRSRDYVAEICCRSRDMLMLDDPVKTL